MYICLKQKIEENGMLVLSEYPTELKQKRKALQYTVIM